MRHRTRWGWAAALAALAGCGEAREAPGPEGAGGVEGVGGEEARQAAAPACAPAECAEGERACDGDDRKVCKGGKWERTPCDEAGCKAAGKGPVQGCILDDQDQPTCVCGCTAADSSCVDDKLVSYCGDDGGLFRFACDDELCKSAGYKGVRPGSGCKAGAEGAYCDCEPSCEPGVVCAEKSGKAYVTVCDGAKETTQSCDDVCKADGEVASTSCAGVNENGDKVCLCGTGKCGAEGQQECVGSGKVRFCDHGVWLELACSDKACKDAGFSGWSGTCGTSSSGKETCLCN